MARLQRQGMSIKIRWI